MTTPTGRSRKRGGAPGKNVTIKDLAAELEVSITTISRALNGYADVGEKTREKIVDAARRLGYTPNRNAQRLEGLPTPHGPLRVIRIPMPPHKDGNWRTYTNVVFANGALLVPVYRGVDRAGREKALELFARLLPGWQVIGIDCTTLIQGGGALRCISTGVPLDTPRAAAVASE